MTENLRREFALLTEEELAQILHLSPNTLQVWRVEGKGPKFVKLGKGVFYRDADVFDWIDAQASDEKPVLCPVPLE